MVKVNLTPIVSLSSQQFKQLCSAKPEAKLELTAQRKLVIVSGVFNYLWNYNIPTI